MGRYDAAAVLEDGVEVIWSSHSITPLAYHTNPVLVWVIWLWSQITKWKYSQKQTPTTHSSYYHYASEQNKSSNGQYHTHSQLTLKLLKKYSDVVTIYQVLYDLKHRFYWTNRYRLKLYSLFASSLKLSHMQFHIMHMQSMRGTPLKLSLSDPHLNKIRFFFIKTQSWHLICRLIVARLGQWIT